MYFLVFSQKFCRSAEITTDSSRYNEMNVTDKQFSLFLRHQWVHQPQAPPPQYWVNSGSGKNMKYKRKKAKNVSNLAIFFSIHLWAWLLNPRDIFCGTKASGQLRCTIEIRVTINLVIRRINQGFNFEINQFQICLPSVRFLLLTGSAVGMGRAF